MKKRFASIMSSTKKYHNTSAWQVTGVFIWHNLKWINYYFHMSEKSPSRTINSQIMTYSNVIIFGGGGCWKFTWIIVILLRKNAKHEISGLVKICIDQEVVGKLCIMDYFHTWVINFIEIDILIDSDWSFLSINI